MTCFMDFSSNSFMDFSRRSFCRNSYRNSFRDFSDKFKGFLEIIDRILGEISVDLVEELQEESEEMLNKSWSFYCRNYRQNCLKNPRKNSL